MVCGLSASQKEVSLSQYVNIDWRELSAKSGNPRKKSLWLIALLLLASHGIIMLRLTAALPKHAVFVLVL